MTRCGYLIILLTILILESNCSLPVNFEWRASLDRKTGRASSYEISTLNTANKKCPMTEATVVKHAESCFKTYPSWLCSKQVSYGFLRVFPDNIGGLSIQDSLLGLTLLKFGAPRCRRTPGKSMESLQHCVDNDDNKIVQVLCEFPITGGVLAYPPGPSNVERGSIRLSLVSNSSERQTLFRNRLEPRKQSSTFGTASLAVESAIVNFQPAIGGPPPVSAVRQWVYLYTQRLVHAHVMRRFHGHCYKTLILKQATQP